MHAEVQGERNRPLKFPAKKEPQNSLHRIVKNKSSNRMLTVIHRPGLQVGKELMVEYVAKALSFVPMDFRSDKEDLKLRRLLKHVSNIELDRLARELMLGKTLPQHLPGRGYGLQLF